MWGYESTVTEQMNEVTDNTTNYAPREGDRDETKAVSFFRLAHVSPNGAKGQPYGLPIARPARAWKSALSHTDRLDGSGTPVIRLHATSAPTPFDGLMIFNPVGADSIWSCTRG